MSNIWITADIHYNHRNIVRGISEWKDRSPCRDFFNLEEYNNTLVENINNSVHPKDTLYMLGDIVFGGAEFLPVFLKQIRCKNLYLVYGNHDIVLRKRHEYHGYFKGIEDIMMPRKGLGGYRMVLCHYPIHSWYQQKRGSLHCYGHTHRELNYHPNAMCVSLECNDQFRPFNLDEIIDTINKRHAN